MRRFRVVFCFASSTQQMNSFRARGVMSYQASSAAGFATRVSRRSPGNLWTTPPGTRCELMTREYSWAQRFREVFVVGHGSYFFDFARDVDMTRGAIKSPNFSIRFSTSFVSKRSSSGLPDFAHLSTSSHDTGVDTVSSGRARSE